MKYLSIRQAAKQPDCPLREGTLRKMVKMSQIPGFYCGSRFWIDYSAMLQVLKEQSRATVQSTEGAAEALKN